MAEENKTNYNQDLKEINRMISQYKGNMTKLKAKKMEFSKIKDMEEIVKEVDGLIGDMDSTLKEMKKIKNHYVKRRLN